MKTLSKFILSFLLISISLNLLFKLNLFISLFFLFILFFIYILILSFINALMIKEPSIEFVSEYKNKIKKFY